MEHGGCRVCKYDINPKYLLLTYCTCSIWGRTHAHNFNNFKMIISFVQRRTFYVHLLKCIF